MSYDWAEPLEEARYDLEEVIVGHKITSVTLVEGHLNTLQLTLDTGAAVEMIPITDCCAYGEVDAVIQRLPDLDHVITSVATDAGYESWHILADAGEVLGLDVAWSEGSGYYAYGIEVVVKEVAP